MRRRRLAQACTLAGWLASCGSEPPPAPKRPPAPPVAAVHSDAPVRPPPPKPRDRSADVARELGVDTGDLVWSPARKTFAVALPEGRLSVYAIGGEPRGQFQTPRPGTVSELRYLGEERVSYLLLPPPPPPRAARARKQQPRPRPRKPSAPPGPPSTTHVIQPISEGALAILCEGRRFVFAPAGDHVAWVAGDPGHEHVRVDGVQVYPRNGGTTVQSDPAWSGDGASLALIEGGDRLQLVVLVEFDNPNGDNTWPLPSAAADPALRVFWAGRRNIVVGPEMTKPVFSTSFERQ